MAPCNSGGGLSYSATDPYRHEDTINELSSIRPANGILPELSILAPGFGEVPDPGSLPSSIPGMIPSVHKHTAWSLDILLICRCYLSHCHDCCNPGTLRTHRWSREAGTRVIPADTCVLLSGTWRAFTYIRLQWLVVQTHHAAAQVVTGSRSCSSQNKTQVGVPLLLYGYWVLLCDTDILKYARDR